MGSLHPVAGSCSEPLHVGRVKRETLASAGGRRIGADAHAAMLDAPSAAPDPVLEPFLSAGSDEIARERLGELLLERAAPLVATVLRRQLGSAGARFGAADLEDLHAATLLKLQLHLVLVRKDERPAPASFADYVAVAAYNAAASFLMALEPERTRLRDRLRYVLRRDARLASWYGLDRELICGLATDRGRVAVEGAEPLRALVASETEARDIGWGRLPARVGRILERLAAPCRFEAFVDALAERLGIVDLPLRSLDELGSGRGPAAGTPEPADSALPSDARLELDEQMERLWSEIAALPLDQRRALLFNLRGAGGEDLLDAFLSTGVVDVDRLAAALGLTVAELAELSPSLPRDDLWIADRLGASRQRVINLRRSARLRLARRLRGLVPGVG